MLDGQFDWGGRLLKSNGGVQRFPQNGWKPFAECKGRRELDCETDRSSRCESRAYERTRMDAPRVNQLFCQEHSWVAKCGSDKR